MNLENSNVVVNVSLTVTPLTSRPPAGNKWSAIGIRKVNVPVLCLLRKQSVEYLPWSLESNFLLLNENIDEVQLSVDMNWGIIAVMTMLVIGRTVLKVTDLITAKDLLPFLFVSLHFLPLCFSHEHSWPLDHFTWAVVKLTQRIVCCSDWRYWTICFHLRMKY